MSQKLISRNEVLMRFGNDGYSIENARSVPARQQCPICRSREADQARHARRGKLVLAGDDVLAPDTHTIHFVGSYPHNVDGTPI